MSAKQTRPGETGAGKNSLAADTILRETYDNADSWWIDCAERAVSWWAAAGVPFTADDLRDLGVPEADHPNRWGALFAAFHRRGTIVPVGYRVSTRKARHGGVLRVWRGVPALQVSPLAGVAVGRVDVAGLTRLADVATGVDR